MDATNYKESSNKAMSKWIDFSLEERKAMIQGVVEARQIDEAAAEKDWWVTAEKIMGSVLLIIFLIMIHYCLNSHCLP